jgi:RNA polymerase sigma-70 factor (ECF subfamily)
VRSHTGGAFLARLSWYSRVHGFSIDIVEQNDFFQETGKEVVMLIEPRCSDDNREKQTLMSQPKDEFLPTRRSLLTRLKRWDDDCSWRRFFDLYWKLIYGTAVKAGLTDDEAQEVVQDTVVALAKTMPAFKYDPAVCSFKGWLLHLTRCRVADQFRKRRRQERLGQRADPAELDQLPDPAENVLAKAWEEAWRNHLLQEATNNVRRQVRPRQFQIFDLYVLRNWPAAEVARAMRVSLAQVYLARHRIGARIRKGVKLLETNLG